MAQKPVVTASEALAMALKQLNNGKRVPFGYHASFKCPFPGCGVYAQHRWGVVQQLAVQHTTTWQTNRDFEGTPLITALCEACGKEAVFIGLKMIWPFTTAAPAPSPDLPESLKADYAEASAIHQASPRGAAALLRLLIQKLCTELGSTEPTIDKAIGAFVKEDRINGAIQRALDTVRVIGNEAVHPGEMDLRDDAATVLSLFKLVNFIVEKMITEPKEVDALFESLPPKKLAGIAQRDAPRLAAPAPTAQPE